MGTVDETPGDPKAAPPVKEVTVNMLVAYNMARWRQANGMTQSALGEELGGWTKGAVSAAERSWDGERVRKFNADEIAEMASVFRIPIPAFFLPPDDDGKAAVYVIRNGGVPMDEYFRLLMPDPDWEADTPAAAAYQQAVITATAKYLDSDVAEQLAVAAEAVTGEQVKGVLEDARETRAHLLGLYRLTDRLLAENGLLQDTLERALKERES